MNGRTLMSRIGLWVKDLLFPPVCVGCRSTLPPARPEEGIFCEDCFDAWERDRTEAYYSMGGVLPDALSTGGCSRHLFLTGYHTGRTQGVSERLIYHMKHADDRRVFDFVANAFVLYLIEAFPDLPLCELWFAYAPRRRRAVLKNGVDQSEQLANALARATGGTAVSAFRRHGGREQKKLTAVQRRKNVAATFSLKEEYRDAVVGKTVVLVDDLMTTGATLGVCSTLLASAGAAEVVALTVARTVERDTRLDQKKKKKSNRRHKRKKR